MRDVAALAARTRGHADCASNPDLRADLLALSDVLADHEVLRAVLEEIAQSNSHPHGGFCNNAAIARATLGEVSGA